MCNVLWNRLYKSFLIFNYCQSNITFHFLCWIPCKTFCCIYYELFIHNVNSLICIGDIWERECHNIYTFAVQGSISFPSGIYFIMFIKHGILHVEDVRILNFGMNVGSQFTASFNWSSSYLYISHKGFWHISCL